MALTDVNFQEGEEQEFILEIPEAVYSGVLSDIDLESGSSQFPLLETPKITGGSSGGNIFIIND